MQEPLLIRVQKWTPSTSLQKVPLAQQIDRCLGVGWIQNWKKPILITACVAAGILTCVSLTQDAAPSSQHLDYDTASAPQNEVLLAALTKDDEYRRILALSHKPPYWEVCVSSGSKPILFLSIFGLPGTDGEMPTGFKKLPKQITTLGIATLTASGAVHDAQNVWRMCTEGELGLWQRINGVAFALSVSPNLQTAATLHVLKGIYVFSWSWRVAHGIVDPKQIPDPWQLINKFQGNLWLYYYKATVWAYSCVLIVLCIFFALGFLAYCWAALLWFALSFAVTSALNRVPKCVARSRGDKHCTVNALSGHALDAAICTLESHNTSNCFSSDQWVKGPQYASLEASLKDSDNPSNYWNQHECFEQTGAPLDAWTFYFAWPIVTLIFAMLGPVVARLYTGGGYFGSISATWQDRHIVTYVVSLFAIAGEVVGAAHAGWLALVSRWAQFFNFWV